MPPEIAAAAHERIASSGIKTSLWRAALWRIGLVWTALVMAFASDWAAMAGQWWNSSTYNHILLVPVIIGWLVYQRWPELERITPETWWPGLVLLASAGFIWVLSAFAGLAIGCQLGAVLLLAACVPTILGLRVTAGLLFPIFYMLFLVPFGDELVPPMQMVTAAITIALVRASGIPATIDGVFIDTPAGLFEVAEACSGVKFLVAMIAFGTLVANVCFVSWRRRAAFLAICVAVPVLANGVRAWGTIQVAQFTGAEYATGFDHIVYGWLFFAVVIALVLALSWRFFDRAPADPMIDAERINALPLPGWLQFGQASPAVVMTGLATIALLAKLWVVAADRLAADLPSAISLPDVAGWQRTDYHPAIRWEPRATGASHRLLGSYIDADGRKVDVFFALYSAQREGAEAGGFGEGAVPQAGGEWAWLSPGPSLDGGKGDRLIARGSHQRTTVTWFRSGNLLSGSDFRFRLSTMLDRLLLRERPSVMLILSAEERPAHPAAEAIEAFRRAAAPFDGWVDRIASGG